MAIHRSPRRSSMVEPESDRLTQGGGPAEEEVEARSKIAFVRTPPETISRRMREEPRQDQFDICI